MQPNVLVIMADQLKATALPRYGNPDVKTPALEQLAASGVSYDLAFTSHPLCVPARVSMWTGAYPHDHGVRTNELRIPNGLDNYLRRFAEAGYELALLGKDHCFGPADRARFDRIVEYGHLGRLGTPDPRDDDFTRWIGQPGLFPRLWVSHETPVAKEQCPASRIADEACAYVKEPHDRPFLAWVSFPEPHEPYYAPEPFASLYDPGALRLPAVEEDGLASKPRSQRFYRSLCGFDGVTLEDLRPAVATYYAMVSFVDDCIGRLLDAVAESGRERDTIVVFTADHGDFSGEHGLMVKCKAFYDCLTRIPLVVSWPGELTPCEVPDLVSIIDVMPTLASLTGIGDPAISRANLLPGTKLPAARRDAVFAEYGAGGRSIREEEATNVPIPVSPPRPLLRAAEAEGRAKMVRTTKWKYVHDPSDPVDELYDLEADPWELVNLAGAPEYAVDVAAMRRRLLEWSLATEDAELVRLFFDERTLAPSAAGHPADRREADSGR